MKLVTSIIAIIISVTRPTAGNALDVTTFTFELVVGADLEVLCEQIRFSHYFTNDSQLDNDVTKVIGLDFTDVRLDSSAINIVPVSVEQDLDAILIMDLIDISWLVDAPLAVVTKPVAGSDPLEDVFNEDVVQPNVDRGRCKEVCVHNRLLIGTIDLHKKTIDILTSSECIGKPLWLQVFGETFLPWG